MWTAYSQAKTFRCLPSELYKIRGEPESFYFDRAVHTFGARLEAAIEEVKQDGKRTDNQKKMAINMLMNRWLGTAQFASVAKAKAKRV